MTEHQVSEERGFGSAVIDPTGRFRYRLGRRWGTGSRVCWIMLNPSTADAEQDDPTIRRCIAFSKAWGYGSLVVVNLFALRSTDPRKLRLPHDFTQSDYLWVVGDENDQHIEQEAESASLVVAAWGNHGALYDRWERARGILGHRLHHLGLTKTGQPRHPLYVRGDTQPEAWA